MYVSAQDYSENYPLALNGLGDEPLADKSWYSQALDLAMAPVTAIANTVASAFETAPSVNQTIPHSIAKSLATNQPIPVVQPTLPIVKQDATPVASKSIGFQQYDYPIGPQLPGFQFNRLVAPVQPRPGITLPEGYGFQESIIKDVPNYVLYGGVGVALLMLVLKRKKR